MKLQKAQACLKSSIHLLIIIYGSVPSCLFCGTRAFNHSSQRCNRITGERFKACFWLYPFSSPPDLLCLGCSWTRTMLVWKPLKHSKLISIQGRIVFLSQMSGGLTHCFLRLFKDWRNGPSLTLHPLALDNHLDQKPPHRDIWVKWRDTLRKGNDKIGLGWTTFRK